MVKTTVDIVAVANRKGGAGKSTIAANVAVAFARDGLRVLLIDMDSTASATEILYDKDLASQHPSMANVLEGKAKLEDAIQPSFTQGVWIAPATDELTHAQIAIVPKPGRESILRRALRHVTGYDVVLIDTPPERHLATANSLVAATHVVMPFTSDPIGIGSLFSTRNVINELVEAELTNARVLGCVQVAHDTRLKVSCDARRQVAEQWSDMLFDTILRFNTNFVVCPAFHQSIFEVERSTRKPHRGSEDVLALAREIRTRLQQTQHAQEAA
jgi:chromosome partitioning protein